MRRKIPLPKKNRENGKESSQGQKEIQRNRQVMRYLFILICVIALVGFIIPFAGQVILPTLLQYQAYKNLPILSDAIELLNNSIVIYGDAVVELNDTVPAFGEVISAVNNTMEALRATDTAHVLDVSSLEQWNLFVSIVLGLIATVLSLFSLYMGFMSQNESAKEAKFVRKNITSIKQMLKDMMNASDIEIVKLKQKKKEGEGEWTLEEELNPSLAPIAEPPKNSDVQAVGDPSLDDGASMKAGLSQRNSDPVADAPLQSDGTQAVDDPPQNNDIPATDAPLQSNDAPAVDVSLSK